MPAAKALLFGGSNVNGKLFKSRLLATSVIAGFVGALALAPAHAQEAEDDIVIITEDEEEASTQERVVVTGSRIARDTFTSTSPLQVLTGETINEAGVLDLGEALQSTSVVQGIQLDQTFNATQVSDAGPGAQSVALRGLDAERTLVLINGRRYAPAGIEGAPSFPDISLIPTSAIERTDILLDGASSVYGSDAVAGVVNIILRSEFEGLEIGGQFNNPLEGGSESYSVDFIAGVVGDFGHLTIAGEHYNQEALYGCDRDWMRATANPDNWPDFANQSVCGSIDISEDGTELGTQRQSQSFSAFPFGAILLGRAGQTDGAGIPNFIQADLGGNFNGLYGLTVLGNQDLQLSPSFQRSSIFVTGEFDLNDFVEGMTAFTEFNLSNRQSSFTGASGVIDAAVQPSNPYIQSEGFTIGGAGPTSNFTMRPLDPTPSGVESELTQYRFISGVRGDLAFLSDALADWDYEAFGGYTRSQGYSDRGVILEENLIRSLNTEIDPATGTVVCAATPNPTAPFSPGEVTEPCIPFNPFFAGLYPTDGSDPYFEDPRLLDYLSGTRSSTTFVDETLFGAFVSGPIFELPAGEVQVVLGTEFREDAIDTRSDDVTARGLGSGFFSDRPTSGTVDLLEFYGEVFIPILSGQRFAEDLSVELAGRAVDHEFYGRNSTYAVKGSWSPTDYLTFRATYGTSFRAPNLRELFLEGQSSFAALNDPCEVPTLAQTDTDGDGVLDAYTPGADNDNDGVGDLDGRRPDVLANCQAEGLDPFSLAIGINTGTVETYSSGNTGLDPETSESYSYGFVFEQPFTDKFDLRFGMNFWEIEIEDSVFNPSAGFLVNECYTSANFPNDPFCTRRLRDPNTGFLLEIDATPFNIASETASGMDVNVGFNTDFSAFGRDVFASVDLQATRSDEISQTIILPGSPATTDEFAGEIGNPEWRLTSQSRLSFDEWSFFWQMRYIDGQTADFDDQPVNCNSTANGGTASREVPECYTTDDIFYHDVSVTYDADTWSVRAGIRNLLDQDPPRLDEDVTFTSDARNVPLGAGYDRIGRTIFVNVSKRF
ncbi:MAG TPA: hypothetical protein DDZ43_06020 [Hyphomonadaceae bacterium]|nr:hypothetical protein [Hyphomonadaceae bacterium]HBJ92414.1 hypothetical protein [Hyphomonadaceae bacterium]